MSRAPRQHYPLHIHLSVVIVGLIAVACLALGWHQYHQSTRQMLAEADQTFAHVVREASAAINNELKPARTIVALMSRNGLTASNTLQARRERVPQLAAGLRQNEHIASVYVGTKEGSFLMLRHLKTDAMRKQFEAPEGAAYLVQSVDRDDGLANGQHFFYNDNLDQLEARAVPQYQFDPRTRPWFSQAMDESSADTVVQTAPYVFFSTREVGLTVAARHPWGFAVVGADVTLGALSDVLISQRITPSAELVIFDSKGLALAYLRPDKLVKATSDSTVSLARVDELGAPVLTALWQQVQAANAMSTPGTATAVVPAPVTAGNPRLQLDGLDWMVRVQQLPGTGANPLYLGVAAPSDELLADARRVRLQSVLISACVVLLMLPLAWWASRFIAEPLRRLALQAQEIQRFKFDAPDGQPSLIQEVEHLAESMTGMKRTIQRFLEISAALSAEPNFQHLLDRILAETISTVKATAGVVWLTTADGQALHAASSRFGNQPAADVTPMPDRRLDDPLAQVSQAAREGRTLASDLRRDSAASEQAFGFVFDWLGTSHFSVIAVPLRNRKHEIIGVLALYFDEAAQASAASLAPERVAFVEALSGTAAVAIDNQQLILAQKQLLESFIQLIAGSIDAKSPYTGGHCQRVPELTKMLAQAACDMQTGPFADYQLSEEQWEELHIASWLHDCGKVTTPEYVVDKATKLETIYDRIHEIRMRFEVLKRDAEIALYQQALAGTGADLGALHTELAAQRAVLDEEYHFVATCNEGGEFMAPEKVTRLRQIAARPWQRTLDDRIGISHEERTRKAQTPAPVLPVTEALLADKAEHILLRPAREQLAADNPWGFKLKVPEHLYNRGEVYNLAVGRGTLTEEERYKINDHIVQTIRMLDQLPFPKHLRRVPEIAGGHHEKMDGTGYPRRLHKDEMSASARMMAIADIFEALTAEDRPYKKGKRLSEALKIMSFMVKDQHIDAELFELFLRSGVYLAYAERFMNPEQIDAVDVEAFLAKPAAAHA